MSSYSEQIVWFPCDNHPIEEGVYLVLRNDPDDIHAFVDLAWYQPSCHVFTDAERGQWQDRTQLVEYKNVTYWAEIPHGPDLENPPQSPFLKGGSGSPPLGKEGLGEDLP
jgi:hypothetical protein